MESLFEHLLNVSKDTVEYSPELQEEVDQVIELMQAIGQRDLTSRTKMVFKLENMEEERYERIGGDTITVPVNLSVSEAMYLCIAMQQFIMNNASETLDKIKDHQHVDIEEVQRIKELFVLTIKMDELVLEAGNKVLRAYKDAS